MPSKEGAEDNDHPDTLENLDELAVPSLVEADTRPHRRRPILKQGSVNGNDADGHSDALGEGDYDPPDDYENLNELKAPSPVESLAFERPHGYLEGSRPSTTHSHQEQSKEFRHNDTVSKPGESPFSSASDHGLKKKIKLSLHHPRVSRFVTEFYTVSYLILFSILGTLARLGLQALTFYPGAPIPTGVLWANVAGSFFIGFLIEDRNLFRGHPSPTAPSTPPNITRDEEARMKEQHAPPNKKSIPLYIGLATGFCGSFTSFSSFIRDAFFALANTLPVPVSHTSTSSIDSVSTVHRNGGYSCMALLAVIITTVALCISALIVGAELALALEKYTPSIPYIFARKFMDRGIVFLAWGSWLGSIFMAIWPPDRPGGPAYHGGQEHWRGRALFAIVFAPLGCLARFYISLLLNAKIESFPMGTFTINMCGTAMDAILWDLQHSHSTVGGGVVGCQVLEGMMDGFCGAATTVSTWVAELRGLRRRHACVYGAMSVLVALGIMVGVMGGLLWGRGWQRPMCS